MARRRLALTAAPEGSETNQVRGRNGWFTATEVTCDQSDDVTEITVSSNRPATMPPVIVRLSHADAALLGSMLMANRAHERSDEPEFYTIQPGDVGKTRLTAFGREWIIENDMAPMRLSIQPADVGCRLHVEPNYPDSVDPRDQVLIMCKRNEDDLDSGEREELQRNLRKFTDYATS
jgi:hypothetical protein